MSTIHHPVEYFADGCYRFALSIATAPPPATAASLLFDYAFMVYFVGDSGEYTAD
jgi:hypothetical protein